MQGTRVATTDYATLVDELDERIGGPSDGEPVIIPDGRGRSVPLWIRFVLAGGIVGAVVGWARTPEPACPVDQVRCSLEALDIDALRATIPDAELFARLPALHELDPDDQLTAGDVFDMEHLRGIDPATLITPEQLDRVLARLAD